MMWNAYTFFARACVCNVGDNSLLEHSNVVVCTSIGTHQIGNDVSIMQSVGILLYPTQQICIFCDFIIPRRISLKKKKFPTQVENAICSFKVITKSNYILIM